VKRIGTAGDDAAPSATETWKTMTLICSAPITTKPYVILSIFLIVATQFPFQFRWFFFTPKTLIMIHTSMLIKMITGFG
jgi:hypothetical protein